MINVNHSEAQKLVMWLKLKQSETTHVGMVTVAHMYGEIRGGLQHCELF